MANMASLRLLSRSYRPAAATEEVVLVLAKRRSDREVSFGTLESIFEVRGRWK